MSGAAALEIEELTRRGALEREALSNRVEQISERIARRRLQWKMTGAAVGGLAAAATLAFKIFGRSSPAARIGRAASAASIAVGLARAFLRLKKFL